MFDRLVESEASGADAKPRRRIFVASMLFFSGLFCASFVASIFAANIELGTSNFDIAELLTPVPATEPVEEQPQTPRQQNAAPSSSDRIQRQFLMQDTANSTLIPENVSVNKNPYRTTDPRDFTRVMPGNIDSAGDPGAANGNPDGRPSGNRDFASSDNGNGGDDGADKTPPPAAPKVDKKPPPIMSGGVMTGKATSLPKPAYSAAAKSVNAQGTVTVQILISETGSVISAKAISGHVMLRPAAEAAARLAKFSPTKLSDVPVKVTGVISYNFVK